jgi:outer membrane biosynthesis protein TonB
MAAKEPISDGQLSQLVRQENLKKPLRWVIGLHVLFIVVAAIGLPRFREPPMDLSQAVNVDLVAPTADMSAAPNKTKSKELFKPQAKPVETKKPPVAQPEKPPSAVQSDAAKKEDTPKPVEKLQPPKEKVEEPKKEAIQPADKKKIEKPKKPTPKKSRDDGAGDAQEQKQFNSVLKNLLGDVNAKADAPEGNPIDAPSDPTAKAEGTAPVTSDKLALSEMDALKYQLAQCWNVPSGAMNAADLIVDIRLEVNPDRTVKTAEIVDQSRYNSDDFFRAAADSARRAVFNPRCTPLALPPDKYDTWKNILIRFNPKDMFGG